MCEKTIISTGSGCFTAISELCQMFSQYAQRK